MPVGITRMGARTPYPSSSSRTLPLGAMTPSVWAVMYRVKVFTIQRPHRRLGEK